MPALNTAWIQPQAAAVWPCASRPRGPSTWNGAMTMQRTRQPRSSITQSQVRDFTSCQPSRSSTTKLLAASLRAMAGTRRAARKAALTRKVAPSTAMAPPAPITATSVPATAGPTIQPKLSLRPMRALACWSLSAGTSCGMMAPAAGLKNASAAPWTAARMASCHTCATPLSSRTAPLICTAALMVASDLVRAAVQISGAVLLLSGVAQVWQLAILAAVHGAAEAFFRPAAGALMPQLVPAERLQQANALMGLSDNFGWMVGPAVAGTLVAVIGAGGAIAVDGATFLVSAAFPAALRVPAIARSEAAKSFVVELRDGWHEVKSRTWLWVMLLRGCLVLCIVIAPFQVLGPLGLLAQGHTAAAWGWIQAVFSAGMLGGAAIALRYKPRRPMVVVCLTGTAAVAAPLTLALGGGALALGVVYGLRGIGVGFLVAVWNTTLQTKIQGEALGRVTAWDWMSSLALWPAGLAVAGRSRQAFGLTALRWASAGLGLVASLWVLFVKDVWRLRPAPSRGRSPRRLAPG